MPREYQIKTEERLPHAVYMQVLYIIRDIDRLKAERERILYASPAPPDGLQRQKGGATDPTLKAVMRMEEMSIRINAVEKALKSIPKEYRAGILNNIIKRERYPIYAGEATWRRWRYHFTWTVAHNLRLV
jgi:hypothetical protein